jgi:hypothetical protein
MPWPEPVYIGDELVTNGTFDTDLTGFETSAAWSVIDGEAVGNDTASENNFLRWLTGAGAGKVYLGSVDVVENNGMGSTYIQWGGDTSNRVSSPAPGNYTQIFVGDVELFRANANGTNTNLVIDNISVREIDPLSVSIQMEGRMTYADEGASTEVSFWRWRVDSSNQILSRIDASGSLVGRYITQQTASGTYDQATDAGTEAYAPGINVPFNIASRHGSTFINAAADGTSYVANTTPVALPDLSSTDFSIGYDYMGTIKQLRVWPKDLADAGIEEAST